VGQIRLGVAFVSNKLRIVFEKGEGIRFIGHLDILRTFIRGLKRANMPVRYSEGFNPHAVMTFALPMGVGVTSECEIMDVTFTNNIPANEVIDGINSNMQEGSIRVIRAEYTDEPMPEIEKAEYVIDILNDGKLNIDDVKNALAKTEIMVEKKSKKQVKQINIIEHIFESEILSYNENSLKIRIVISAGNSFNVKPSVVISGLEGVAETFNPIGIKAHRTKFLFKG